MFLFLAGTVDGDSAFFRLFNPLLFPGGGIILTDATLDAVLDDTDDSESDCLARLGGLPRRFPVAVEGVALGGSDAR